MDIHDLTGDHSSVAEELLQGVSEIEEKVLRIDECVEDLDFSFEEALKIYNVSKEEYNDFKNKK